MDTLQGRAIQKINELWGDEHRGWNGYQNIGIPVCKKKYRPFEFQVRRRKQAGGGVEVTVERMYGCQRHGERKGWEPFGQWSMSKAKAAARRETARLNVTLGNSNSSSFVCSLSSGYESSRSSSSENDIPASFCFGKDDSQRQQRPWQTLCHNGTCNWKIRGKFDDICSEIEEERLNKYDYS